MSIFKNLFSRAVVVPTVNFGDPAAFFKGTFDTHSNMFKKDDYDTISTVYTCIKILSETISRLPLATPNLLISSQVLESIFSL